jgi:hypothetical protein
MRNSRKHLSFSKWPVRARFLMAMGVLLLPSPSFAQAQFCAIRQAVATYGYAAAIEVGRKGSDVWIEV